MYQQFILSIAGYYSIYGYIMTTYYSIITLYIIITFCLFMHQSRDIWVVFTFQLLRIMLVCTSLFVDMCFHYSWIETQVWNCGSYGKLNVDGMFYYIRKYKTVYPTIFHSCQQCLRVSIAPDCCQQLVF